MKHVNPTTGAQTSIEETPLEEIAGLIHRAAEGQRALAGAGVRERVRFLRRTSDALDHRRAECVTLIGEEMGKPAKLADLELTRTREEIDFLADHAEEWLECEPCPGGKVHFDPLGVVAVVSPWNFPFLLPLRGILAGLTAGNGVVFKPSELTPRCGILLAQIVRDALGTNQEALQIVVGGKAHGQRVVESNVELIAFTGSTDVGKSIAAAAALRMKRCVLELGGLDAAVVLRPVDLHAAAREIVLANARNSGQVCNAVKRVLVEREIFDAFVEAAQDVSSSLTIGEPSNNVDMGPIVSETQLARVEAFVADAREHGARVLTGGARLTRSGNFYPHTLVVDVKPNMRLMREECFGPVLPIMPIDNDDEAVCITNDTRFGLTASVWTSDLPRAESIARQMKVGSVGINSHKAGPPGSPWGGAKESGLGRMKTKEGLREFTNVKFVTL